MGKLFFILVVLILFLKNGIGKVKSTLSCYPFDKNNTLGLRGLLSILIVVHHWGIKYFNGFPLWLEQWGMIIVAIFFFLSGFGLMKSFVVKGNGYLEGFFIRRFSKILIPFVIASSIWCIWLVFFNLDMLLTLIANLDSGKTLLPNSWFCFVIMLSYLVFYIGAKRLKNKNIIIVVMSVLLLLYIVCVKRLDWGNNWYMTCLAISSGLVAGYYEIQLMAFLKTNRMLSILVLCGAIILLSGLSIYTKSYKFISQTFMICVYIILPFVVFICINSIGGIKNKLLNFCGLISYEIYLVHGIFFDSIYYLWPDVNGIQSLSILIAGFIFTIPAALALHWMAEYCNGLLARKGNFQFNVNNN